MVFLAVGDSVTHKGRGRCHRRSSQSRQRAQDSLETGSPEADSQGWGGGHDAAAAL